MSLRVGWLDFEPEPDGTGDGSGDPDKHILTIANGLDENTQPTDAWPDEIAVIVHRTCDGKYPIDGVLANRKRRLAQVICDALNEGDGKYAAELSWLDEENSIHATVKREPDSRTVIATVKREPDSRTVIAGVVREHNESESHLCASEEEARKWLVGALFLIEDGRLAASDPTPTYDQLVEFATDYGWTVSIQIA